jgi:hypothetical protein
MQAAVEIGSGNPMLVGIRIQSRFEAQVHRQWTIRFFKRISVKGGMSSKPAKKAFEVNL